MILPSTAQVHHNNNIMETLTFSISIQASAATVADRMLGLSDRSTYGQWTAVFNPTSQYDGTWAEGEKIYFTTEETPGKRVGMVSEVVKFIPNRFVSIRHYGILDGDAEVTEGPEVEPWVGAMENYTFEEKDGITTVTIEVDTDSDYVANFNEQFPEALRLLKKISES